MFKFKMILETVYFIFLALLLPVGLVLLAPHFTKAIAGIIKFYQ